MRVSKAVSDIEIARQASMLPIEMVAARLGLGGDDLEVCGKYRARISVDLDEPLEGVRLGRLILVSSITPRPGGEGKTTTCIGLADALNRLGQRATACVPDFAIEGRGAGGGYAQVVPMEEIDRHFAGDFHRVDTAHKILATAIDNHIVYGNALDFDARRVAWTRTLGMNARPLRHLIVGRGEPVNSFPRESGFDITVASEIMAIVGLSESRHELEQRLGRIVVGVSRHGRPITARQLNVYNPMAVPLREALKPSLVQTLENNPVLLHGGPLANIAHGCNSVIANKMAMRLSAYTITEASFDADLGTEYFFDTICRQVGIRPDAIVLVAAVRALKMHGGVDQKQLSAPNPVAIERGMNNLEKHLEKISLFGPPVVVGLNSFAADTNEEIRLIQARCDELGVQAVPADHWAYGGAGAEDLARAVAYLIESRHRSFRHSSRSPWPSLIQVSS